MDSDLIPPGVRARLGGLRLATRRAVGVQADALFAFEGH